jgi:hypothetical protein
MKGQQKQTDPVVRGVVAAVSCNDVYAFSKPARDGIRLIAGLGVAGDVHAGVTVRHRSRIAADPDQPNLRQVHLIQGELHDELSEAGYEVPAGGLGENVTTSGIDLLALPVGTVLRFGPAPASTGDGLRPESEVPGPAEGAGAVVAAARRASLDGAATAAVAALSAHLTAAERSAAPDPRPAVLVTGLRNPCQQINNYRSGLLKRVLGQKADGSPDRRAGVMAVVLRGGLIRPGTEIAVELPALPHRALDRV